MRRIPRDKDRLVVDDEISIPMIVPSGQLGLRSVGHALTLRITRDLEVYVCSPSSGRVIASGAWNLCGVVWGDVDYTPGAKNELCVTALEILDARVYATVMLFKRIWLCTSWLTPAAKRAL